MEVSPKSLEFKRPFTASSTSTIVVTNTSSKGLAFKVKTTAPKIYCVKPNSAFLNPGASIDVSIVFQGLPKEPALGTKCKDRFLIVGIQTDDIYESKAISSNWAQLEEKAAGVDQKVKLKVSYNFEGENYAIPEDNSIDQEANETTTTNEPQQQPIITKEPITEDKSTAVPVTTTPETKSTSQSVPKLESNKIAKKSSSSSFSLLWCVLIALFAYYIYKNYV